MVLKFWLWSSQSYSGYLGESIIFYHMCKNVGAHGFVPLVELGFSWFICAYSHSHAKGCNRLWDPFDS